MCDGWRDAEREVLWPCVYGRLIRTVGGEKCKSQPKTAWLWSELHSDSHIPERKKKLLLAFTNLTLNPAKSLWNKIPFSSIIPFNSSFHASLRLTWYTYNYHPFFLPSSSKLPLIHSSMTSTSAPISFCLNLFTVSFNSPLFPRYYFSMWVMIHVCIASLQLKLEWPKKSTLQPWLFIIITRSNGMWSAHHNGPLTLQIEGGNKNRRESGTRDKNVVT